MLMRFHFGLGVGHIYSHHPTSQDVPVPGGSAEQDDGQVVDDYNEDEGQEDDSSDEEEGGDLRTQNVLQGSDSSSESLISQFNEMYGSDVELDYEN